MGLLELQRQAELPPRTPRYVAEMTDENGTFHLDFSVPGYMQDFAVEIQRPGERPTTFRAYHTQEAALFATVLQQMAYRRDSTDSLADIARIRTTLAAGTVGYEPADESATEHDVSDQHWSFHRLADATTKGEAAEILEVGEDAYIQETVGPAVHTDGLYFATRIAFPDEPVRQQAFSVAQDDLWQFATGIMTRSYALPGGYGNSRWPGMGYHKMLDDFEVLVATR